MALGEPDVSCHTPLMAIENYLSASQVRLTGHAPSRVRTMLRTVGNQLQVRRTAGTNYMFVGGKVATADQLLVEIGEALAEWERLEEILIQERAQRQRIDARISAFVTFFTIVRAQIRFAEQKRRRPLTSQQKVVAAAKLRETRRLRKTLGKRQKKALKSL
jgi:hypothetical protein